MGEFFDQSPRQQDDPAIRERERPHLGAVEALLLPAPRRVASVDALRGFTMFWIMGADGAARRSPKCCPARARSHAAGFPDLGLLRELRPHAPPLPDFEGLAGPLPTGDWRVPTFRSRTHGP